MKWLALLCLGSALAIAASAAPTTGGALNIVLLEDQYRVNDTHFERRADLLKFIQQRQPESIQILVCISARDETALSLTAAIRKVHKGPLNVGRLPKRAVECSQHLSKDRARAS